MAGWRAKPASRSNSWRTTPRYSSDFLGRASRPVSRASVSARRWVSTIPTTTSTPSRRLTRASSNIAKVFPTPGLAPKKTLSLPRFARASASLTWARRRSGSGRRSLITSWCGSQAVQRKVEPEHVDPWLPEEPELAALGVDHDQRLDLFGREGAGACHPIHLERRSRGGDVGIEPAPRSGDEV